MKKLFFIMLLAAIAASAKAQTPNCAKFKNGTFKMTYDGMTDTVVRKGALQTELFNGMARGVFNVKWTDDCSYTLTPTAETLKTNPGMPNGVVTVHITKTTATGYTQVVSSDFSAQVFTMDAVKIK